VRILETAMHFKGKSGKRMFGFQKDTIIKRTCYAHPLYV
jgi:hypothetical protein